jgi:radical SAM protein with 4Fe4S-binding SPASM domain
LAREALELELTITDTNYRGSKVHFLRFDMYPLYAPSHPNRHHGFWDLPLKNLRDEHAAVVLNESGLLVRTKGGDTSFPAVWKGSLAFKGYCILHVSLWKTSRWQQPTQLETAFAKFVILPDGEDLSLSHITIPVTQRCNLTCPMCMRHSAGKFEAVDIPTEVLDPLIEASRHVHSAMLVGIGEPLLYSNCCGIIGILKQRMPPQSQVGLTTNGILLNKEIAGKLIALGTDWICFSLDGATSATAEKVRPGLNFERVLENASFLSRHRKALQSNTPWLTANYVMTEENVHEMPAFMDLAASLGLDAVTFSHLNQYPAGRFALLDESMLLSSFQQVKELGKKHGIIVLLPLARPHSEPWCYFMESPYVWMSGEVVPCCHMLDGAKPEPTKKFGNVTRTPLLEIWNSPEYRAFRRQVLEGDLPDECGGCSYSVHTIE